MEALSPITQHLSLSLECFPPTCIARQKRRRRRTTRTRSKREKRKNQKSPDPNQDPSYYNVHLPHPPPPAPPTPPPHRVTYTTHPALRRILPLATAQPRHLHRETRHPRRLLPDLHLCRHQPRPEHEHRLHTLRDGTVVDVPRE